MTNTNERHTLSARKRRRQLILLALLCAAIVAAVLAVRFAAAQFTDDGSSFSPYLGVRDRTHLSVCVDGVAGVSLSGDQIDLSRAALDEAVSSLPTTPPELAEPELVSGCPAPGALDRKLDEYQRNSLDGPGVIIGQKGAPSAPSPQVAFLYFVPIEKFEEIFGDQPYATAAAEFVCEGDFCYSVTTGVYVPALAAKDIVTQALIAGLSLSSPAPEGVATPSMSATPPALATP